MTLRILENYSIPEETDCVFTKPSFGHWPCVLRKNKKSLLSINNRRACVSELVNIGTEYTQQIGLPVSFAMSNADVIATGHQPVWHHCGIFAKNIITNKFALQSKSMAIQLVLDHDVCKTSMLVSEIDINGFWRFKTINIEKEPQDVAVEFRPVPPVEQLRSFVDSILNIRKKAFCSDVWHPNLVNIIDNTKQYRNLADIITRLQGQLNTACGLDLVYLPVSLMSESNSFLSFVYSIICDAVSFAKFYNRAIEHKRMAENLKANKTLKLLMVDTVNKMIELPFWLVSKGKKRTAMHVNVLDGNIKIGALDDFIGTIDSLANKEQQFVDILRKSKYMIRPKAVTLMLFSRLYLADMFVHGVGSVNYEYITDYIIRYFHEKPKVDFGIATATMTIPENISNKDFKVKKDDSNYREFFFGLFSKNKLDRLINSRESKV